MSNIVNMSPADCLKRFGIYGSLIHGPLVHLWLSAITRLLPGTTPFLVLVKVATDQVPCLLFLVKIGRFFSLSLDRQYLRLPYPPASSFAWRSLRRCSSSLYLGAVLG